jgi:glutathione S-transferase
MGSLKRGKAMSINLYYLSPRDCSGKVRWLLEELNVPYNLIGLDWKSGDLKTAEYLEKNPIGQVPVIEDGDVTLFESYGIVAYLADKYLEKGLAPKFEDSKARGRYYQWLFFAVDTADDFFTRFFNLEKSFTEHYKKNWEEYIRDKTQKVLGAVEKQLDGKEYILGGFSAADTALGYSLWSVSDESFFGDFPRTKAYFERLKKRPAAVRSEIFDPPK